jgi:hypothetical protein
MPHKETLFSAVAIASSALAALILVVAVDWLAGKLFEPSKKEVSWTIKGDDTLARYRQRTHPALVPEEAGLLAGTGVLAADGPIYEERLRFAPSIGQAKFMPFPGRTFLVPESFEGRFFNCVDGFRRTVQDSSRVSAPPVYVIGGSTVFNGDTIDAQTLPSRLAARWKSILGTQPAIVNLGVNAQHSNQEQERIEYESGLRLPAMVVVYGGVNELAIKVYYGIRGVPLTRVFQKEESLLQKIARKSNIVKMVRDQPEVSTERIDDAIRTWTIRAANEYIENLKRIEKLGRERGFAVWYFFQPVLYTRASMSTRELQLIESFPDTLMARVFLVGYPIIRQHFLRFLQEDPARRGADLSGMFDQMDGEVYRDMFHLLPHGNDLVAQAMLKQLAIRPVSGAGHTP